MLLRGFATALPVGGASVLASMSWQSVGRALSHASEPMRCFVYKADIQIAGCILHACV